MIMSRHFSFAILALSALLIASYGAHADTLHPTDDAYISFDGNGNFGGHGSIAVIDWPNASKQRQGFVRFDFATLPDDVVMDRAILRLYVNKVSKEGTIGLYEEMAGEPVHDIEYYELLAGMRFSVILTRLGQQLMDQDFLPKDSDFEWYNPVSNLHAKQLDEMGIR